VTGAPQPARVTITRRANEDARERQVVVSIDGRSIATLMFGDSVTREVEPGRHGLLSLIGARPLYLELRRE
jgi:hypothetical protein